MVVATEPQEGQRKQGMPGCAFTTQQGTEPSSYPAIGPMTTATAAMPVVQHPMVVATKPLEGQEKGICQIVLPTQHIGKDGIKPQ